MIHKSKSENPSLEENENSWLGSNLYRLMLVVTVVWFAIVLIYITQFFGWSNLFLMMPDEFGGFLAGATLPLALIWVGMAYVDRSAAFKKEAKFLRAYMNQLVYPEEGGAATAKAMSEAIRSQVSELQEVTKLAMSQTSMIKKELDERVDDFASLVRVLDNYSTKSIVELTNGVKTLTKSFDGVTDKAFKTTKDLSSCIAEFSSVATRLQGDINGIVDNLLPGMHEIKNSADVIQSVAESSSRQIMEASENIKSYGSVSEENFNLVYEKIQAQGKYLEDITNQAVESTRAVGETFRSVAAEIDELIETRGQKTVEYAENMDNSIQEVYRKISEHSDLFVNEAEKIIAQTALVEDNISSQANELKNIADTVAESLRSAEDSLNSGFDDLDERSSKAVENLREVVDTVKVKTENLITFTDSACDKINAGSDNIAERFRELQGIGGEIGGGLDIVGGKFAEGIDGIRKSIDEMMQNLNEVNDAIAAQTERLNETGNMAVAQSRLAESSLAEQHGSINASLAKIEEIKSELNRQIEELSTAAGRIAGEAGEAVDRLKENLSASLEASGKAAEQTRKINDSLEAEVRRLDEAADAAAQKVSGLESTVAAQSDHLRSLIGDVDERTAQIAAIMEKHENAVNEATGGFSRQFAEIVATFESQSELFNSVAENTAGVSRSIREQIAAVGESADSVFAKMSALEDEVARRGSDVADKSNVAIDKLSEIDQAIAERIRKLDEDLEDISARQNRIAESIAAGLEQFGEAVDRARGGADEAAAAIVDSMNNGAGELGQIIERIKNEAGAGAEAMVAGMNDGADRIGQIIERIKNEAGAGAEAIVAGMSDGADRIGRIVEQAKTGADEAAGLIAAQNDKMTQIAEDTKALTDYFNNLMNNASEQLIEKANVAHDRIRELGEGLQQLGRQLEETAGSSAEHFAASGEKLRSAVAEVMTDAERVAGEVRASHEAFKEQSDNLRATADETLTKVSEVMGSFSGSLEEFTAKSNAIVDSTSNFNGVIKKQIELLDIGAKQAGSELADIEKRYREMKVENFLKNATSIIEKLETLAVDINMIFNPESQDKLWQKYYEGDTDVFVRYLSRTMSRKQVVAIKEEFEKNPEFRKMVNAYMGEFEELINRARGCEKSGILLSVISGADIGKIYYVIARALDKLN